MLQILQVMWRFVVLPCEQCSLFLLLLQSLPSEEKKGKNSNHSLFTHVHPDNYFITIVASAIIVFL